MTIREQYNLTEIINARGTFTPLGVSRSSKLVCDAVSEALSDYYLMSELQDVVGAKIAEWAGTENGAVSHCAAAAITISIAAVMTGETNSLIASLPDTSKMRDRVVIPACHAINYGHEIEQAIRLSGATPVFAGTGTYCSIDDIKQEMAHADTCSLLLVSSRLIHSDAVDLAEAVEAAHARGIVAIVDGAAQDMRVDQLISTKADIVLFSAQKYLASPTAGLIVGGRSIIRAVWAQEKGIGRGMKASKEAIIGVLAALEERDKREAYSWSREQELKISDFVKRANTVRGVDARSLPDPTGLPFKRACLAIDSDKSIISAEELVEKLKSGKPTIWVMDDKVREDEIVLELVQVTDAEIDVILARLSEILDG